MKIAVIGSGISGLGAAYLLNKKYDVTLFETQGRLGGHTATKAVEVDGQCYEIDTGFIVYNDWTYPNFIKLLEKVGVESQATSMGFSVFEPSSGFEYAGNNINTLFSQRKNFFDLNHWQMIKDILRFNRESIRDIESGDVDSDMTLGAYLESKNYSQVFIRKYLFPMGAAIWSSSTGDMLAFPLYFFVRFFHNHGLLNVKERPTWRVIKGGSKQYIDPLTRSFKEKIRLNERVERVSRVETEGVSVQTNIQTYNFDHVVFACHSDQALALISDPTETERAVLSALKYRKNDVVLHLDTRWLPRSKRTWSSWNYCLRGDDNELPVLTYNMNILQGLQSKHTFCVTLNARSEIEPSKVLGHYQYDHPVFSTQAIKAQAKWDLINVKNTWFCGAYWFNGFHEDGLKSAVRVAEKFGVQF